MSGSMKTPMETLLEIMKTLRNPNQGCPWDRKQTFASIVPHTIEEAYEVLKAAPGVEVFEDRANNLWATPLMASGQDPD